MERGLLSEAAAERLRRARVLRRALRHSRSELDVLRPAARGGHARLGGSNAARVRVLVEAVPEIHSPEDVRGAAATICSGCERKRKSRFDRDARATERIG